ncbi:hypothetical protein DFP72DRAFT_590995 [Ephemerocybe angulata]|uniref:Uncharacterized protein n=1 Tax=Ephemerocybe angulata TaxID=980116 RepID=A0A8H6MAE7_9AGAR|nr:hypothetical protein DFP72DRAFT_590995 [Tulosesus angulatus]
MRCRRAGWESHGQESRRIQRGEGIRRSTEYPFPRDLRQEPTKNATNVEQACLTMAKQIKDRYVERRAHISCAADAYSSLSTMGSTSTTPGAAKSSTVTPGQTVQSQQGGEAAKSHHPCINLCSLLYGLRRTWMKDLPFPFVKAYDPSTQYRLHILLLNFLHDMLGTVFPRE